MKTGILGGTFNPIHYAHLRIAEEVREVCGLDRILFLPAATPPHKEVAADIAFAHRLAMVKAAIADNPFFEVSDLENRRPGKSYSVHTLEILKDEIPGDEIYFIIGMDSFRDLSTWKEYARLFELAHIVVASRPGITTADPASLLPVAIRGDFCYHSSSKNLRHRNGNHVIFLEETFLDISSTDIRHLIAGSRSIRYLLPRAVEEYIFKKSLYRG
ncbi:nicotinate-nucleotide adenylyltransferase [Desulfuromonas sp. AOP6]|uniref:nicotinate-nucleotide adenylyltransferase n=1 Tax=Desulfuromonas sp. AOP6 TaxID=1566351 RepID=UPI00126BFA5C|nr:nicotinate-nucleotide adenylyltransferase [Desulfuromonas sp. AOP6]BCA80984.1 putative nicotinate-nucleotideadenylyltransferase [Desulfuromonas sp. AOP6]